MQADQVMESAGEPPSQTRWMAGILTAVGALVVIFVAMNVNSIASFLIADGVEATGAASLWAGSEESAFAELRASLGESPSDEEIAAAVEAAATPPEEVLYPLPVDGRFVILPQNPGPGVLPFGIAIIKAREADFVFLAVLQDGSEVRGFASQRSEGLLTAEAGRAAIKRGDAPESVYGYAQQEGDGSFSAWGQRQAAENEVLLGFAAYRLPYAVSLFSSAV